MFEHGEEPRLVASFAAKPFHPLGHGADTVATGQSGLITQMLGKQRSAQCTDVAGFGAIYSGNVEKRSNLGGDADVHIHIKFCGAADAAAVCYTDDAADSRLGGLVLVELAHGEASFCCGFETRAPSAKMEVAGARL
ncbi:hypothetical protein C6Q21_08485 [Burkholderia multivorans]|nr:hypothetical protein C6P86_26560 [Burkholderia multivorans]PRE80316.1 hypothetical protein C6Q00_19155 [Burkholderia multivorans]PRG11811.1 hypothetical protein C6Q21_08485 [Burkholderia multivorans]PRG23743.1 hypothetical protein C6T57_11265 [Burkholderia multivorans]PRH18808.1 hypothetical protein C6T53_23500 [Burkholderia multivorans]